MNRSGKSIDKTHLSIDQAEQRGFIHRDYIAHCLRWSHVIKFLQKGQLYKTADILDIGCGKEVPLAKTMYSSRLIPVTGSYTGIDVNRLEVPSMFHTGKFPIELIGQADVAHHDFGGSTFRVITCFEVLEHVEPAHSLQILRRIHALLEDHGDAFISTPCYDAATGAAGNHVNEMSYEALGSLIERAGFTTAAVYGTFASISDYQDLIEKDGLGKVFDRLRGYYDVNYLATIFAPLYPERARNCLWHLKKAGALRGTEFPLLKTLTDQKHSSSAAWGDFVAVETA